MKILYQVKFLSLFITFLLTGCSIFPLFIFSDVSSLQFSEWNRNGQGLFLIQIDTTNKGGLLFKSFDSVQNPGIYQYSPKIASISLVDDILWDESKGKITKCLGMRYLHYKNSHVAHHYLLRWPNGKYNITMEELDIITVGAVTKSAIVLPDKKMASILSVDGPEDYMFIIPLILTSATWMAGQQYHQFFSLDSGKPIGKMLRLPFQQNHMVDDTTMCFSPDEKYVIYSDNTFRLVIIPVPN